MLFCFLRVKGRTVTPGEGSTITTAEQKQQTSQSVSKKAKIPSRTTEVGFHAEHRVGLRVTTATGALPPCARTCLGFASMFSGAIV